jgi:hypothetical protein
MISLDLEEDSPTVMFQLVSFKIQPQIVGYTFMFSFVLEEDSPPDSPKFS